MCLILLAYRVHPKFPLIIAANRDEFHARPTEAAAFRPSEPQLLMGKDIEAGGTWFGVDKSGRFAAVTNAGTPLSPKPPLSRGKLPMAFLHNQATPFAYATQVKQNGHHYQGFNLLVGHADQICFTTNQDDDLQQLSPGLYGLANGKLEDNCFRIQRGKQRLTKALKRPAIGSLLTILADSSGPPEIATEDDSLGRRRQLTPCFIIGTHYGTRASTVFLLHQDNQAEFTEQTWLPDGVRGTRQDLSFQVTPTCYDT